MKSITKNEGKTHVYIGIRVAILALGVFLLVPGTSYAVDPCSGGTISYSGGYTYHRFTGNGTLSCSSAVTADVLIVGGGGSGGESNGSGGSGYGAGGGGGAGGVVIANGKALSATNYSVTVGAGGLSAPNSGLGYPTRGGDSIFDTGRAKGGGYGGKYGAPYNVSGGSGGGGPGMGQPGSSAYQPTQLSGANNYGGTGYGNSGGAGGANQGSCNMGGGGGGGAGGAGGAADPYYMTGAPGAGLSVWSGYITVGYGGGGGPSGGDVPGTTYSSNYGSGGGGGADGCYGGDAPANGVQGVVIVRYATNPPTTVSVTPSSGTYPGGARTFTTVHRDVDGATDISYGLFLLNGTLSGNSTAFYGYYERSTNICYIFNSDDAGGWASQSWSADVNTSGPKSLPWVTLNSCSSVALGNDLYITWNLTFNSWVEDLDTYIYTVDNLSALSGWVDHGSITVNTALPRIASTTVSAVGASQVTAGGNLVAVGSSTVTARGTCYDTTAYPTANCTAEGGTATGVFSHVRSGLTPNTLYYFRAYATNASGTVYSEDLATTTLNVPSAVSATDQTFDYGQSATAISTITVTDGTGSVSSANDIRIAIATSSVNMRWDTTDTTATFGGTASGKVSNPVSYEGGGSVLVVPVDTNFIAGETLTVSGLSFKDFNSVNAPANALILRIGGAGDPTAVATDTRTVAIRPTLGYVSHTQGQVRDKFNASTVTGETLFAFKFVPAGETVTVGPVIVQLVDVTGIVQGDISNVALYRDENSNRQYDAGTDTQVGGAPTVSVNGKTGTITFSSTFSASASADYILVASVANLAGDDRMFITLGTGNLTTSGETAGSISGSGSLLGVLHVRTNKGGNTGGGGGIITTAVGGETVPTTTTITTGGSEGTGGTSGFIDPDSGTPIGNEPGFFPPSGAGSPYSNWTSGSAGIASDGSYAVTSTNGTQQSYAFTFDPIPTTNTINGIAVKLEGYAETAGTVSVKLSWDGGASVTSSMTTPALSAVDDVYLLGSPSDKWGRAWSPSDFNSGNFRVEVINNVSEPWTTSLDAIQVRVYHQASGGSRGGGGAVFSGPNTQYANAYTALSEALRSLSGILSGWKW